MMTRSQTPRRRRQQRLLPVLATLLTLGCGHTKPAPTEVMAPPPPGAPAFPLDAIELRWGVWDAGEIYDFVVRPVRWEPDFLFEWTMTGPVFNSGRATVTAEARAGCEDQTNRFGRGENAVIDGCTVVFSRDMFKRLVAGQTVDVRIDGKKAALALTGRATYDVMRGGKSHPLNVIIVEGEGYRYMLLDDERIPLIVRQSVGFPVWLKEARQRPL